VIDSQCSTSKPATTRTVDCTPPVIVTYEWVVGNYTYSQAVCPTSGQQTGSRSVTCRGSNGSSGNDSQCTTDDGPKPPTSTSRTCTPAYTYSWVLGAKNYESLSQCLFGSRPYTQPYICRRSDNTYPVDSVCINNGEGSKPADEFGLDPDNSCPGAGSEE
jgi:hypothetical protein